MFGISTGELLILGLIALIVLGPERLPKAARFAGVWIRRARSQWYSVKSELDRELAAEELKRSVREAQQSIAGVNLDEEAANLIRYQQAYQASSKVMTIASKLFDEVLALGR